MDLMLRGEKYTNKEIEFIKTFLFSKDNKKRFNGTNSILAVYNTTDENTASVMSSEILQKPKIKKIIDEYILNNLDQAKLKLKKEANNCVDRVIELSKTGDKNDLVKLRANETILNRTGITEETRQNNQVITLEMKSIIPD